MSSPLLLDMIFIDRITGYTGWKRKSVIPSPDPEASGRGGIYSCRKEYIVLAIRNSIEEWSF